MFDSTSVNETKVDYPPGTASRWRRIWKYLWIPIAVAALTDGWIVLSRWDENKKLEEQALEQKRAVDKSTVEFLGGDRFEILHFYASPGLLEKGGSTLICYGVSNAKIVRLDPPAGTVWPSFNRCLRITPSKTTSYTLSVEDAKGTRKSQTLTVQVR